MNAACLFFVDLKGRNSVTLTIPFFNRITESWKFIKINFEKFVWHGKSVPCDQTQYNLYETWSVINNNRGEYESKTYCETCRPLGRSGWCWVTLKCRDGGRDVVVVVISSDVLEAVSLLSQQSWNTVSASGVIFSRLKHLRVWLFRGEWLLTKVFEVVFVRPRVQPLCQSGDNRGHVVLAMQNGTSVPFCSVSVAVAVCFFVAELDGVEKSEINLREFVSTFCLD